MRHVKIQLVCLLLCVAGVADAASRPDVTRMRCAEARALVLETNGVVVTTGPHTYQRFVANHRGCDPQDYYLRPAFTPSRDQKSCRIGYTCENYNPFFPGDDD